MPIRQCAILVGGLGTRLGKLTADRPKPLIEVAGQPFVKILMAQAARHGISNVLLLAGHKASQIEEFARTFNREQSAVQVDVSVEADPLGTAGAISFAKEKLDDEFLLLNGDSVFDFDWTDLSNLADRNPEAKITMGLHFESDTSRYGVVEVEGEKIIAFRERGSVREGLINGGVYFFRRSAVDAMPAQGSLERDVLPSLAHNGVLAGKCYSGTFLDIGVPSGLQQAQTRIMELGKTMGLQRFVR